MRESFILLILFNALGTSAGFATVDLAPKWEGPRSSEGDLEWAGTTSSLMDHSSNPLGDNEANLLDPETEKKLQLEYGDMTRDYEARKRYSTSTRAEDLSYKERSSGFSLYVLRHIINYQISEGFSRAEENSSQVKSFRTFHEAVGKVAKGDFNVVNASEESSFRFEFGTRTDLPKQSGTLWMNSSLVNGTFDLTVGDPWAIDPWTFESLGDETHEQYRVSLNRGLPVWDLQSGLSYGGTSTIMSASVSKMLTPELRCELGARQGMDRDRSGLPEGVEETVKVEYGLKF